MTEVSTLTPEALPFGLDGVIVRFALQPCPDAMAAAQLFVAELAKAPISGVVEVAPALVTVLLRFDATQIDRAGLIRDLLLRAKAVVGGPAQMLGQMPPAARRWTIPVAFGGEDGPQLAEVAELLGCRAEQAVRQICAADLRVLAIGFTPGQPYIGLLPEAWALPRMPSLNPAVPAGAIVVAVRQITMFSAIGATGWRQVGRSGFRSFQPDREPPILLQQGDAIRYEPVSGAELAGAADGQGGARLELLS